MLEGVVRRLPYYVEDFIFRDRQSGWSASFSKQMGYDGTPHPPGPSTSTDEPVPAFLRGTLAWRYATVDQRKRAVEKWGCVVSCGV